MTRTRLVLAAFLILAGCLGCDLDPFGLPERAVVPGYRLKEGEGDFYLVTPADTGDLIPGPPLERLGWDRAHLVVLRRPEGAEPGAWTVIELPSGRTRGPLTAAEMAADPAVTRIPTCRVDSAWDPLTR